PKGADMQERWITAFAQSLMPSLGILMPIGRTARLAMPLNVSGKAVRLRFSNIPGRKASVIQGATLCFMKDGKLAPGQMPVTFAGQDRAVIPPGELVQSDAIPLPVLPGLTLALSMIGTKQMHTMNSLGWLGTKSPKGDFRNSNFESLPQSPLLSKILGMPLDPTVPLFRALDVLTSEPHIGISVLGDSLSQQGRWLIPFMDRAYKAYPGQASLLSAGISGNSLTLDTEPAFKGIFGDAAIKRIESDCFSDHGVNRLLFALGANDVFQADTILYRHPLPTPEMFLSACEYIQAESHARGITTVAFTIFPARPPKKNKKLRIELRQAFNDIIRKTFDLTIECDPILLDGTSYKDGYSSPDGTHLTELGGKAFADALDLKKVTGI
ncbi:MAG: hypothetical protein LBT59_21380, partial [Clostridiales bacterium]|nr:hypothetical protein [Clostridiales bacterium]